MEIIVKSVISVMVLVLTQSCSAFESDYEKLMNPIKKIKLAEKKAGKPAPAFDGVVEPDFPDEKENNKTLEGVDSNHDGVRDDIEIWINRTAEDEYVRVAMKENYRKLLKAHLALIDKKASEQDKLDRLSDSGEALHCLSMTLYPYRKKYLIKKIEILRLINENIQNISFNTSSRKNLLSQINSHHYIGATRAVKGGDISYCSDKLDKKYLLKVIEESQENRKW